MNIFYFDTNPEVCAQMHCDKALVKMILEYAQLLSTAHRVLDGKESLCKSKSGRNQKVWTLEDKEAQDIVYKATHINHPSAKWARHCAANYDWLAFLWTCLMDEYTFRYGKRHACERLIPYLCVLPKNISTAFKFSPPWRAMPDQYKKPKTSPDYCEESYRAYFNGEKQRMANWKGRNPPHWYIPVANNPAN